MNFKQFEDLQAELFIECQLMGRTKGKEYAYSLEDRFQNFNELAKELKVSRLLIAWVYTRKHINSISSYIINKREFSDEKIRDRIVDVITYLSLILAMDHEEKNCPTNPFSYNAPTHT
jgi:hypothetical protein